ncbi:uncharacterized protein [Coffea arabica]|uniref:DUF309 domain-containing protein n=1 Tax=Coffea arabica TaxID=13443 RepID=A0A6P6SY58_COFAR|nr:uncharacterized protein LOC113695701 [Coffea arabica]
MAILSTSLPSFTSPSSSFSSPTKPTLCPNPSTSFFNKKVTTNCQHENMLFSHHKTASYRYSSWGRFTTEEEEDVDCCSFQEAVELFNKREYYRCHDVLESLWNKSQEPTRTLVHGILQCAVGFHHLFNQNHRGAMMELGEGLCKLRKMNFEDGPFDMFEKDISGVLDFIYQTQLELAACTEDLCITMDQSERSYQLLGGYAAGQPLYRVQSTNQLDNSNYIVFCPERNRGFNGQIRIRLPILQASEDDLMNLDTNY